MRNFVCSTILAVAHAIKSQTATKSASHAMVDAMVRDHARNMPQQLAQVADSCSELRVLIESSYESWYQRVYTETITRLEAEDPLPEFCDQAAGCSKEIEERIRIATQNKWKEIFEQFINTVESTCTPVIEMIE